jgi:hypothetical protein
VNGRPRPVVHLRKGQRQEPELLAHHDFPDGRPDVDARRGSRHQVNLERLYLGTSSRNERDDVDRHLADGARDQGSGGIDRAFTLPGDGNEADDGVVDPPTARIARLGAESERIAGRHLASRWRDDDARDGRLGNGLLRGLLRLEGRQQRERDGKEGRHRCIEGEEDGQRERLVDGRSSPSNVGGSRYGVNAAGTNPRASDVRGITVPGVDEWPIRRYL